MPGCSCVLQSPHPLSFGPCIFCLWAPASSALWLLGALVSFSPSILCHSWPTYLLSTGGFRPSYHICVRHESGTCMRHESVVAAVRGLISERPWELCVCVLLGRKSHCATVRAKCPCIIVASSCLGALTRHIRCSALSAGMRSEVCPDAFS